MSAESVIVITGRTPPARSWPQRDRSFRKGQAGSRRLESERLAIGSQISRGQQSGIGQMNVLPSPCDSCPYRRDCPSGVWHESEYKKLRDYDHNRAFTLFLCHQTPFIGEETACRGWLTVHSESVAARLAVMQGLVTDDAPVSMPLYSSGEEAADAGEAKIKRPGKAARKMIEKIGRQRT